MPIREENVAEIAGRLFQEILNQQQSGESLDDTLLRLVGFIREDMSQPEVNLLGGLFKRQDLRSRQIVSGIVGVLTSLRDQLQQMSFDRLSTKIVRLERLLGAEPSSEVLQARRFALEGDLPEAENQIRQILSERRLQIDLSGSLTDELKLLRLLLDRTDNIVLRVPVDQTGTFSSFLIDLVRAPTQDIEERTIALQQRYRALQAELIRLRRQRDLVATGVTVASSGTASLVKTIDFFLFAMRDIQYNCGECRFLTDNKCTYGTDGRDTSRSQSCAVVWGLIGNDFWTASHQTLQDAREVLQRE